MKEIVISLLEDSELDRAITAQIIKDALKPYVDAKRISYVGRDKYRYNKEEEESLVQFTLKLEDCESKFMGAFQSWFAYESATVRYNKEDDQYEFSTKRFDVQLNRLSELACMVHRINGLKKKNDGYGGKIQLKMVQVEKTFGGEDVEIEPLKKHLKYFNKFSEFNPYDF